MFETLKIIHLLSMAVGLGGGVANAIVGAKVGLTAPQLAGPVTLLIGRLGFAGLVLLWLTGIAMVAMAGGVAAMGAWFWVKMLAALMLTAAAVALQVATFTLPPERRAARVKPLGMVMLAGSVLSLVFAVLAFG